MPTVQERIAALQSRAKRLTSVQSKEEHQRTLLLYGLHQIAERIAKILQPLAGIIVEPVNCSEQQFPRVSVNIKPHAGYTGHAMHSGYRVEVTAGHRDIFPIDIIPELDGTHPILVEHYPTERHYTVDELDAAALLARVLGFVEAVAMKEEI